MLKTFGILSFLGRGGPNELINYRAAPGFAGAFGLGFFVGQKKGLKRKEKIYIKSLNLKKRKEI